MFMPNASSTSASFGCFDPRCFCGGSFCTCDNNQCGYSIRYLEGSSTSGYLAEDVLAVGDGGPGAKLVFGCAQSESGLLYSQSADGVFGMGRTRASLHGQLVAQGAIEDVFSICLGAPKAGVLLLGNVALPADAPAPVTTPVVGDGTKYNLQVVGLLFNGQKLVAEQSWFSYGMGTIWDSGTTFSYFSRNVFNSLVAAIRTHVEANSPQLVSARGPYSDDICWKGAPPQDASKLGAFFPDMELLLGGGARLARSPLHYMYPYGSVWCLGFFDNAYSTTLLGANMMLDTVATYDGRVAQMRFTPYECSRLSVALGVTGQNSSSNSTTGGATPSPSPVLPTPPSPPLTSPSSLPLPALSPPLPTLPPPTPTPPLPSANPPSSPPPAHPKHSKRPSPPPTPLRPPPRTPSRRVRSRKSPPPARS
ncbi:hypothetical protein HYH02_005832 [Chlamydomonas schloesseri]|uniref:Peptidase A1 domain-containing protein n=1 Tax=Chlamydomonas schloesseri TaxID=2026947 RepID=A0A835WJZ2_9CHLO|nr:hypothetical protein HYH02_005832 [Chlamydomonas schloesseri]|eukprot:KAG2449083.1 hypothetical protein HYH02_005832 [Chlamydomonas schloesseri]